MSVELRRHRRSMFALACVTAMSSAVVHVSTAQDPPKPTKEVVEKLTPPPAANAQMQRVLDKLASLGGKPIETLTPEEARKQPSPADAALAIKKEMDLPKVTPPGVDTEDEKIEVDNPVGGEKNVNVRVYTPEGTTSDAKLPVVLYIHGGGWVIATNDTYDGSARSLSKQLNAIVVSPEYRKAPEHPYPAAHDDVWNTYTWLQTHAGDWKGDVNKIAVVGESAGGNMATFVCIKAKETGTKPPVAQVLVYPLVGSDLDNESYRENVAAKPLNKAMIKWFTTKTVQNADAMKDPHLFPLTNKADLKGLPPATVILAQIDPLRTEGEAYAAALKSAGVDTEVKLYDGVTHEFFGLADVVDEAKDAQALAVSRLKAAFGS